MRERQIAVVTGASRGIGQAIAIELTMMGYALLLVARTREGLEKTAALCLKKQVQPQDNIQICQADMTIEEDRSRVVTELLAHFGTLHVLIANHGIHPKCPMEHQDLTIIMETNALSIMKLVQILMKHITSTEENPGAIIFINSLAGLVGIPKSTGYAASKHALAGFAKSLREEVRTTDHALKISSIYPGFVDSREAPPPGTDPKKLIQPLDIAKIVRCFLEVGPNCNITEAVLHPTRSVYTKSEEKPRKLKGIADANDCTRRPHSH